MAHVITDAGDDLGDVTDQGALSYYRREPGFSIDGQVVGAPAPEEVKVPAKSASKADWVAFAQSVEPDADPDELEAMTKDELVASYGGE